MAGQAIYADDQTESLAYVNFPFLSCPHINLLGRYAFNVPDSVVRGELRPLRKPGDAIEEVA